MNMTVSCPSTSAQTLLALCYLKEKLLSINAFLGGAHWANKNQPRHWRHTKRIWMPLLRSDEGLGFPLPHNGKRRVVYVERWLGPGERKWDPKNFSGGSAKSVVDAMVRLGWLKDDNEQWAVIHEEQRRVLDLSAGETALWDVGVRTMIAVHKEM